MKLPVAHAGKAGALPLAAVASGPAQLLTGAATSAATQLAAVLAPAVVVCIGMYVSGLESGGGRAVDRDTCNCSCWDAKFKGRHGNSRIQYKNMYFNIRATTALLFIWTALCVKLLGAAMERIYTLWRQQHLRYSALLTALTLFYPLFFSAWAVWNYINEEWTLMLWSQLFFFTTELLPAYCLCLLLDSQLEVAPAMSMVSVAVAATHVTLALKEKVLWGLIWPGVNTRNVRDILLMTGDAAVLMFFAPALFSSRQGDKLVRQQVVVTAVAVVGLVTGYYLLCSFEL